ncbi:integrase catalytic domain-containing protein, partial [Klebsiella pneumoniae]|uniref:integrase catalytic domain-containing protein n=1 Tax=Klebsiella pneumoniae TaxID=573 RepID=UPI0040558ED3
VGLQEETPTTSTPLSDLQIDTFTWKGHKWVTIIDIFSKLAMAYTVKERSAEAVLGALGTWYQFYGVPDRITSDRGKELC